MAKAARGIGKLFSFLKPEPLTDSILSTSSADAPVKSEELPKAEDVVMVAEQSDGEAKVTAGSVEAFALLDALQGAEATSQARAEATEKEQAEKEKVVTLFPAEAVGTSFNADTMTTQLAAAESTQSTLEKLEKLNTLAKKEGASAAETSKEVLQVMQEKPNAESVGAASAEPAAVDDGTQMVDVQMPEEAAEAEEEKLHKPVDPFTLPAVVRERYISHQLWLETDGREGKRFRYYGPEMHGLSFAGLNLEKAHFRGENLYGMHFEGSNLKGADMGDADLQRATLTNCLLDGANLSRANMAFANANYISAREASFAGTNFQGTLLHEADLRECNMRDVNLQGTVAFGTSFTSSQMRNAHIFEAILEGADLRGVDFRGAEITRGHWNNADVAHASFKGASLIGVDFASTDFTVADDVHEEYQRIALMVARDKMAEQREKIAFMDEGLKRREFRIHETGRQLAQRVQQLRHMEAQENKLLEIIRRQGRWMRNSSFWWMGVVAIVSGASWFAVQDMVAHETNMAAMSLLAGFNVMVVALAIISFYRAAIICKSVQNMLSARQEYSQQLASIETGADMSEKSEADQAELEAKTNNVAQVEAPVETPEPAQVLQEMVDFKTVMNPAQTGRVTPGRDAALHQSSVA